MDRVGWSPYYQTYYQKNIPSFTTNRPYAESPITKQMNNVYVKSLFVLNV